EMRIFVEASCLGIPAISHVGAKDDGGGRGLALLWKGNIVIKTRTSTTNTRLSSEKVDIVRRTDQKRFPRSSNLPEVLRNSSGGRSLTRRSEKLSTYSSWPSSLACHDTLTLRERTLDRKRNPRSTNALLMLRVSSGERSVTFSSKSSCWS